MAAVAKCLEQHDCRVTLQEEETFSAAAVSRADAVFSMARSTPVLEELDTLPVPVLNPPAGLRHARRSWLTQLFADNAVPQPLSRVARVAEAFPDVVYPCWLKRGDACAQSSDDVRYVTDRRQLEQAWRSFRQRGIEEVVVQAHVEGDLVKFYGVEGTGFFHYYYPTAGNGFSKFGLERINGVASKYAFDVRRLAAESDRASRLLNLPVYGGDCIVRPDGRFYIIDFNDWPSFSCCREAASAAIARKILQAVE